MRITRRPIAWYNHDWAGGLIVRVLLAVRQVDTPSMIRRREELERRLGEIAKDKLLFTKPKVFIKADD